MVKLQVDGRVSFIQKEKTRKSYPKISDDKKFQKSYPVKILSKLIPLYIKQMMLQTSNQNRCFTVF